MIPSFPDGSFCDPALKKKFFYHINKHTNSISYLKAIPTRERGALVSIEVTTIPLLRVVVFTGSRGTGENSVAAGLAAACAAKPRY
jgi:hypothetical protein